MPGLHLRRAEVDEHGVGLLAAGDLPGVDAEEGGPVARGPAEHLLCRQQRGVARELGQQGGEFHLLTQVQAVVGGGAVRAQGDAAARFERELVREAAAAQLHVGTGAVGDGHAAGGQDLPLLGIHVHAVGGDHVLPQETELVQPAHRRGAVQADAVIDLLARLADVDVQQQAVVPGELGAALDPLAADGIDGMGREDELDASAGGVLPVLDVVLECLRLRFGMPVHDRDADRGTHTGGLRGGDGLLGVEVHVVEEGRARGGHLGHGEFAAAADVVRRQARLGGPDVLLEPLLQGPVVRGAAQQGHGRVRVRIEERGEDGHPFRLDHAVGRGVFRRVQVGEYAVPDQDAGLAAFVQHAAEQDGPGDAEFLFLQGAPP